MEGSISFDGTLAGSIAGGGGGGTTPVINADATVDSLSGDPTCTVSRTGTDEMPTFHFAFSGIVGEEGQTGPGGSDGTSSYASVSKSGNTATITCTDANGTTTAQISDGTDGQTGPAGADGTSAYATVSKSGNTATITCTDANGTTTAQISDGTDGQQGPAGVGVPSGGSTGDVLRKNSSTNYDTYWDNLTALDIPYDNTSSGMVATNTQAAITELKSNLTQLNGLTVYRNLTPQTSCASFNDGSTLPLISLTSNIDPIQEGSGDPSPENIRPIRGFTEANVTRCGKNIATTEIYKNNYVLAVDGAETYAGGFIITKEIKINSSNNYYISMVGGQTSSSDAIRVGYYDGNFNFISRESEYSSGLLRMHNNAEYIRLSYRNIDPYFKDIQIEVGTEATAYEAYNGNTYKVEFKDGTNPLTVYGGTLDVVSGLLTVTDGYIASYNGETLSSTWISDRDVYAVGSTPTTGAEVVYELATPQTYQLTPTQVNSLLGQNYISSDTGNITNVKYIGVLNFS